MAALIRFRKPELQVQFGDVNWPDGTSLMDALIAAGLPVASSCGGDGVCTKCRLHFRVLNGATAPLVGPLEVSLLKKISAEKSERISCQVVLISSPDKGPGSENLIAEVDTPYW